MDTINYDKVLKTTNPMGNITKEEIINNDNTILTRTISQKTKLVNGKTKCYNIVSGEKYYTNNLNVPIRDIFYDSNDSGNITLKFVTSNIADYEDIYYEYDDIGRLITEQNSIRDIRRLFSYDNYGNITNITELTNNSQTTSKNVQFYYGDNNTKLTRYTINNVEYNVSYDNYLTGMPISISCNNEIVNTFEWSFNNLKKYTKGSTETITFDYNASGQRTKKTRSIRGEMLYKEYKYSGNKLIEEYIINDTKGDSNTLYYQYDESNNLYGIKYNNLQYYYMKDIFGNIIGILDSSKNIVCEYQYDAYGQHKVLDGNRNENNSYYFIGNLNPFRYRGYYYDVETGWFWLSSRYYSPELCRFINSYDVSYLDPELVNGLNLYCYCANNPINYVDPSGHAWYHWAIGAGIIVLCAALTVATAGGFAAAGTAFASVVTATMAPTAWSAVFAGVTIGAATISAAGAVIGGKIDENDFLGIMTGHWIINQKDL